MSYEDENPGTAPRAQAVAGGACPGRGCDAQTITSIEVGKYTASLPLAHKLARYFGLAIEDVFDFSDLDGEE